MPTLYGPSSLRSWALCTLNCEALRGFCYQINKNFKACSLTRQSTVIFFMIFFCSCTQKKEKNGNKNCLNNKLLTKFLLTCFWTKIALKMKTLIRGSCRVFTASLTLLFLTEAVFRTLKIIFALKLTLSV